MNITENHTHAVVPAPLPATGAPRDKASRPAEKSVEKPVKKPPGTASSPQGSSAARRGAAGSARHASHAGHAASDPLNPPRGFGPLSAAAWADAIVAFWESARANFDPEAPLDVLDLAPGRGVTVWQMLQALRRRIAALPDFKPRLRYLVSAPQRHFLLPLRSQDELKPLIADGTLVPVLWDPERGDPCLLSLAGRQAWQPRNPVVVLAHDRWSTLAQRLLAVHYGKLLEADLSQIERVARAADKHAEQSAEKKKNNQGDQRSGNEVAGHADHADQLADKHANAQADKQIDKQADEQADKRADNQAVQQANRQTDNQADQQADQQAESQPRLWLPMGTPPLPSALDGVMDRYRAQFNSAPIPIPVGALGVIERIAALAPHGYLVIAAALGATSERKLRLCHFGPLVHDYVRTGSAPVNFHLLEQRYGELGAAVWQRDLYGDMATQLALGNMALPGHHLARVAAPLAKGMLGGTAALTEAMKAMCARPGGKTAGKPGAAIGLAELETMLALLRQSEYDPEVFCAAGDGLINALHAHPGCNRDAWSEALALVWSNHLAAPQAPPLHRQLAAAAMQVGDWSLARRALRRGIAAHGENATDLAHLAWIAARTGTILDGQRLVARAQALERGNPIAREVAARIESRLGAWDREWRVQLRAPTMGLAVEPLDVSHAEALLYQYRDPQIGVMTGLQALTTLDETRTWITGHVEEAGRRAYALMHVDHGFVGYVCLSVSQNDSYFCFWTGVDFQGRRYAGEAARLVLELARQRGITTIFTSAYDDNVRSIRALQRIGFAPMALRALPPEGDRLFLYLRLGAPGQDLPAGDPDGELVAYYRREKLSISFVGHAPFVPDPDPEGEQEGAAPASNH